MAMFQEMLAEAAINHLTSDTATKQEPYIICNMCRDHEPVNDENGFCIDCQRSIDRGYQISQLAGRCANGAERDSGILWHARMLEKNNHASLKSLCGYTPGRRSVGWSVWRPEKRTVTCPKCMRQLANKQIKPTLRASMVNGGSARK